MKLRMFAIKDRQISSYMTPFFMQSDGQAIRSFSDEVNRAAEDNILYRHPDDFALCYLGEFDSNDGSFVAVEREVLLVAGQSVKVKVN